MGGYPISPGDRFGSLTAVRMDHVMSASGRMRAHWVCKCDCGELALVDSGNLRSGNTKRCMACWRANKPLTARKTHGHTSGGKQSKAYVTWCAVLRRVFNKSDKSYPRYGGRGIDMDPRWSVFETFFADMGEPPTPAHSIDRIDNDRGYWPDNCRWATKTEQARNKRTVKMISFRGETRPLPEWCEVLGLPYDRIKARLLNGWGAHDAFTFPLRAARDGWQYRTPLGTFDSLREAAEAHGMSTSGAHTRFLSEAFPEWVRSGR